MKQLKAIILLMVMTLSGILSLSAQEAEQKESSLPFDPKEVIFEHLCDAYGWEVPFNHHSRIPLPMILVAADGSWHCFSSSHIHHKGEVYTDGAYSWTVPAEGPNKGKCVQIAADGTELAPKADLSITKDVCGIFISVIVVLLVCLPVARWHRRKGYQAPRGFVGAVESLIEFVYSGVIKPSLGQDARRFAPYLLTVFMFIFVTNLLGLMVIFPGGANITGNICVTLVLALFTFFLTNLLARKHYWKEIFWPDVPIWLKCPLPIMQMIEIFGMFTKPASLTIRLFANMIGGHMIVIVLSLIIFILADMGAAVVGATTVVSVCFSIFMLLLDVLVSFIQAYVFTMLSTTFISAAQERGHEEHHAEPALSKE